MIARGSHSFTCHPLTSHEPYLPLLPSHRASPPLAGTHCAYAWRDGQAELTWVAGFSRIGSWTTDMVTHPSTNRARRTPNNNSRIDKGKNAFTDKRNFSGTLKLDFWKRIIKCFVWTVALYLFINIQLILWPFHANTGRGENTETQNMQQRLGLQTKVDKKRPETFEIWIWRRMLESVGRRK